MSTPTGQDKGLPVLLVEEQHAVLVDALTAALEGAANAQRAQQRADELKKVLSNLCLVIAGVGFHVETSNGPSGELEVRLYSRRPFREEKEEQGASVG